MNIIIHAYTYNSANVMIDIKEEEERLSVTTTLLHKKASHSQLYSFLDSPKLQQSNHRLL